MAIDRTNWTALIDDDGSNTVGTIWTKDKVKTVLLDPIDTEFTARAAVVRGVAAGGTGAATLTAHGVLVGEGTSAVAATAAGTAGQVLTSNGASADPTWQSVPANLFRASAFNSVAQVVATATFTVATFDSESYDVGGLHSTSVNTGRLTVPAGGAGVYIIMANWGWATSAAGSQRQAFIVNQAGAALASSFALPTGATRIVHPLFSIASLAVGDYVYLNGYQDTGGNLNTTATESYLAMVRIG